MRFGTSLALGGATALALAASALASPADNKASATNAMIDLFSKQDPAGVERHFTTTSPYRQHNFRIPDGIDALKALAREAVKWKGVDVTTYRGVADGDMVVLQSVYWNLGDKQENTVAFDLFRFDKSGKIVEHWDSILPAEKSDPSGLRQVEGETRITDLTRTEANRKTVTDYITAAFVKPDPAAAGRFLAPVVPDHHSGVSPLVGPVATGPTARYLKIHRTLAEGNFVFVQGEGRLNGDTILEIYDLYRLENGKIVEHWDQLQPVPAPAQWANPNGPF